MKIALLEIENFRGIRFGQLRFGDHTVLVGPNNSGKTTVVEALALILGRDRLVRDLTEHDFFGSNPQTADRIKIVATVTGFPFEDFTALPEWFRDGRGVPVWFDGRTGGVVTEKTQEHQRLACRIGFAARFDHVSLEVETARYFYDGADADVFAEDGYVSVPPALIRELGLFLIPASRSWDRMLSFGSELFRRVIRSTEGLPAASVLGERDRLRRPQPGLEEDARLKPIVDKVNADIAALFGIDNALKLRLTATDSAAVLDAVLPHFPSSGGLPVPAKRQGSGLISLQSLLLLLHFGQKRIEAGEGFCMALEEPELHLPPAVQRRVLGRLQALSTQTIVTTHSPLVAGFSAPEALLILRNDNGTLTAKPMLEKALDQHATNAMRKLFQINRVDAAAAMMSEFVLVPEGKFDFDWLNLLTRVSDLAPASADPCHFGTRVGVIPTTDAKMKETCVTLAKAHPHVCALVDGDAEGDGYAGELSEAPVRVSRVLRWPDGWAIEDVIGWVIAADEAAVMARLNADLAIAPGDRAGLVARLKCDDRDVAGHLKGDLVAYEIIANALTEHGPCVARIRRLLHAIAQACAGVQTPCFERAAPEDALRMVFRPCP